MSQPVSDNSTCILPLSAILCTSTNSQNLKNLPILKKVKTVIPELNAFAKRRKIKNEKIDNELTDASSALVATMNNVTTLISSQKENKNGFMLAIGEALNHVPEMQKTQCLIEVLQIIMNRGNNICFESFV